MTPSTTSTLGAHRNRGSASEPMLACHSRRTEVVDVLATAVLALLMDRPKTTPARRWEIDANA